MSSATEGRGVGQPPDGPGPSAADDGVVAQINAEQTEAAANLRRTDPDDPSTGGINPLTAQAKLRASQAAGGATVGSGFTFTPEEAAVQITQCTQQLNELQADLQDAHRAEAAVAPPAPDEPSVTQAAAVRSLLTSTAAVIEADIAYLTAWQDKLNQAKNNYLASDHIAEDEWSRMAEGLEA